MSYHAPSDTFTLLWAEYSMKACNELLPINFIDFDADANVGEVGYAVSDNDPPLILTNGKAVRILVMIYDYDSVKSDGRNYC